MANQSIVIPPGAAPAPTQHSVYSEESRPQSFENRQLGCYRDLSLEVVSNFSSERDEALFNFQRGKLPKNEEEWHRLVPTSKRKVLGEKEFTRQSILFEIVKCERDYVADLELVQEVFIDPIQLENILGGPDMQTESFISETFFNLNKILAHHQRILDALFARQRDQFLLVQSLVDIILDNTLLFQNDYEMYIAHYPLAEKRHRTEIEQNQGYRNHLRKCAQDSRVQKRDLITFISRPLTHLPQLVQLLEEAKTYTALHHPDLEAIPLLLGTLKDLIQRSECGIEATEKKVRFLNLCEKLSFQEGEIIDLDLDSEELSFPYQGSLSRWYKPERTLLSSRWADLHVALLDNYLLILKQNQYSDRSFTYKVISRPIPLDYLRLGTFKKGPKTRKDMAKEGIRQMFPFTIFHAAAIETRSYVLYASSESERTKWHEQLTLALQLRKSQQERNKSFNSVTFNDGLFKVGSRSMGSVVAATKLVNNGFEFAAVACQSGVYLTQRDKPVFCKVLDIKNPRCLVAVNKLNHFLVLYDSGLFSYSLDLIARAALGISSPQSIEASRESLATNVQFFRVAQIANCIVVLYAKKKFPGNELNALEIMNKAKLGALLRKSMNILYSFRPFSKSLSIPSDTHNITIFNNHQIAICSNNDIQLAYLATDERYWNVSFPKFGNVKTSLPMANLKSRCQNAIPLGVIQCPKFSSEDEDEFLVVYDELGCYIDQRGVPTRSSCYLRWEIKASSFSHRANDIFLFSSNFIEVRAVHTGKLMQVIEGTGIRQVEFGLLGDWGDRATLVAWNDCRENATIVDTIVELVRTVPVLHEQHRADFDGM